MTPATPGGRAAGPDETADDTAAASAAGVDLHCHSTASDGALTPARVVDLARQNGVSALSLTDHDTVAGVAEAARRAGELGLDFLPGVEVSAASPTPGTLHLLGYGVDPLSPHMTSLSDDLVAARDHRNARIVARLRRLGKDVTLREVEAEAAGGVIGRPHIAALLAKKGYVRTARQAFNLYLGQGCLAYFDKEHLAPREAIGRIHAAGGVAVLAHPFQLRAGSTGLLERALRTLVDAGLDGIEVLHGGSTDAEAALYDALAADYGLLRTGGSDFHGGGKSNAVLGGPAGRRVPRAWFDRLLDAVAAAGRRP